ncbi:MAG: hemerythrin domain-containing protein [Armatimonadetes bacterium]|nr:hemerythrin domain-containing protein [Armatimonadota bacterium]
MPDPLTEANRAIHAWIGARLLDHLDSLTALDLPTAREHWRGLAAVIEDHATVEDALVFPAYAALGAYPVTGLPALFTADHQLVRAGLAALGEQLAGLAEGPDLRRKVVLGLDRYISFRHLLMHHTQRENEIMYPRLGEVLDEGVRAELAGGLMGAHDQVVRDVVGVA